MSLLMLVARRLLGHRYDAVLEAVSHERLNTVARRLDELERRTQHDVTDQLAQLLYGPSRADRTSLHHHELKVFSQNGEDGILLRLLSQTGGSSRRLVEVGIGDGSECNSANLIVNWGWTGTLVESDPDGAAAAAHMHRDRPGVEVRHEFVTVDNINSLLPREPIGLLSIDIDGNDYWVWKATEARPNVVVIEYNASLGPTRSVTIPYVPDFDYTAASEHRMYHGASLAALAKLGEEKGLALVGCDSRGVNAFFVRDDCTSADLPKMTAAEAWRPIQKRLRRWPQEEQERMLQSVPFVQV